MTDWSRWKPGTPGLWRLGLGEEPSCPDCLAAREGGPYRREIRTLRRQTLASGIVRFQEVADVVSNLVEVSGQGCDVAWLFRAPSQGANSSRELKSQWVTPTTPCFPGLQANFSAVFT